MLLGAGCCGSSEEADETADSRDLDADVHGTLFRTFLDGMLEIEGLMALLADSGITAKRDCASKAPAVTPLLSGGKPPGGSRCAEFRRRGRWSRSS